jgi:Ran GTPase-activating protein (RanGAP) involved in mRNA processing and transport
MTKGAVAIGEALEDKKYLEVLIMKQNEIDAEGVLALQTVLQNSKNLKEINLSGNNIGDEGTQILAE